MSFRLKDEDLDIAARTVWGESRGQPFLGQVGVAWVIKNRVNADLGEDNKPDWWGEGYKGVCLKPWQFSCWNKNDPNYPQISTVSLDDSKSYRRSFAIMTLVMAGDIPDPTNGATHYYANYIPAPAWAKGKDPVAVIGDHIFFRMV